MQATSPKRNIQDTIFHHLFSDPMYTIRMYKELHPEAKNVSEADLQLVTLEDILVNRMHNDLGFTIGGQLIVLMEAQSTWSINILLRQLMYLGQTYHDLIIEKKAYIYGSKRVDVPRPEFYIVYTGDEKQPKDMVSMNEEFFNGECWAMDIKAKVIYNEKGRDLLNQYVYFCKIWRQQRKLQKSKQEAIENTLRLCREADVLRDYLIHREKEVIDMMKLLFDQDYIDYLHDYNIAKEARDEGKAEGKAEAEAKENEKMRRQSLKLRSQGKSLEEIADLLEVDIALVKNWLLAS